MGAAQGSVMRAMCGVLLRDQWCEQYVGCCSGISRESNVWGAVQGSVGCCSRISGENNVWGAAQGYVV